jgi:hypothetical protein
MNEFSQRKLNGGLYGNYYFVVLGSVFAAVGVAVAKMKVMPVQI